jgi:hypothetical protein
MNQFRSPERQHIPAFDLVSPICAMRFANHRSRFLSAV